MKAQAAFNASQAFLLKAQQDAAALLQQQYEHNLSVLRNESIRLQKILEKEATDKKAQEDMAACKLQEKAANEAAEKQKAEASRCAAEAIAAAEAKKRCDEKIKMEKEKAVYTFQVSAEQVLYKPSAYVKPNPVELIIPNGTFVPPPESSHCTDMFKIDGYTTLIDPAPYIVACVADSINVGHYGLSVGAVESYLAAC